MCLCPSPSREHFPDLQDLSIFWQHIFLVRRSLLGSPTFYRTQSKNVVWLSPWWMPWDAQLLSMEFPFGPARTLLDTFLDSPLLLALWRSLSSSLPSCGTSSTDTLIQAPNVDKAVKEEIERQKKSVMAYTARNSFCKRQWRVWVFLMGQSWGFAVDWRRRGNYRS